MKIEYSREEAAEMLIAQSGFNPKEKEITVEIKRFGGVVLDITDKVNQSSLDLDIDETPTEIVEESPEEENFLP